MNYTLPKKNISKGFYTFFRILAIINLIAFIIFAIGFPLDFTFHYSNEILSVISGVSGVILIFNTPIVLAIVCDCR